MAWFHLQPIQAFSNPVRNYNPANIKPGLAYLTHLPLLLFNAYTDDFELLIRII